MYNVQIWSNEIVEHIIITLYNILIIYKYKIPNNPTQLENLDWKETGSNDTILLFLIDSRIVKKESHVITEDFIIGND